jgi:hypothetical protein
MTEKKGCSCPWVEPEISAGVLVRHSSLFVGCIAERYVLNLTTLKKHYLNPSAPLVFIVHLRRLYDFLRDSVQSTIFFVSILSFLVVDG